MLSVWFNQLFRKKFFVRILLSNMLIIILTLGILTFSVSESVTKDAREKEIKFNTQILEGVRSYFEAKQRQWDGFHGTFYTPPDRKAGRPVLARSGNIFQFCFPIFGAYLEFAANAHKYMIRYCLKELLAKPLIQCEHIPTTARVTATMKDNMRMVHIKLTHPEPRGKYNVIEDRQTLHEGVIYIRGDHASNVYLAPTREPLKYEIKENYIRIALPKVVGYALVVVEDGIY